MRTSWEKGWGREGKGEGVSVLSMVAARCLLEVYRNARGPL